jgi:hypothetical protein
VRRASVAVAAAFVHLVGFLVLVGWLPSSSFWPLLLAGFYVWSGLALAIGETAVGATPGARTLAAAVVTSMGLLWIEPLLLRQGHSALPACVVVALGLNLVASWTLGRSGGLGAPGTAARYAARLAAVLAALFVSWQVIVDSERVYYFVEARMIADLRTMISAQASYASVNFGFYDAPECLQAPRDCLGAYPQGAPPFLGPEPWRGTLRYYRRRFVPGAPVDPAERPANASRASVKSYAYVAVPAEPDGIHGLIWRWGGLSLGDVRALCGDSTGRICATDRREEPRLADGVCAPECQALR